MYSQQRPRLLTRIARKVSLEQTLTPAQERLRELHAEMNHVLRDPVTLVTAPRLYDTDLDCIQRVHLDDNRAVNDTTDENVLAAVLSWRVALENARIKSRRCMDLSREQRDAYHRAKYAAENGADPKEVMALMAAAGFVSEVREFSDRL